MDRVLREMFWWLLLQDTHADDAALNLCMVELAIAQEVSVYIADCTRVLKSHPFLSPVTGTNGTTHLNSSYRCIEHPRFRPIAPSAVQFPAQT
jgi:hypothetical protein